MIVLFSILMFSGLLYVSFRLFSKTTGLVKKIYWPFVVFKITAGLLVGLLYEFHYQTGDYVMMMRDVLSLQELASTDFFEYLRLILKGPTEGFAAEHLFYSYEPRTFYFVRCLSVMSWFGFSSFWGITCLLGLVSAMVTVQFVISVPPFLQVSSKALIFGFLVPSVMFWSSGFTKESLSLSMLLMGVSTIMAFLKEKRWGYLVFSILLFIVAFKIKYYVVVPFLILFALLLWHRYGRKKYGVWSFIPLGVFLVVIAVMSHPNLHWGRFYEAVLESNELMLSKKSDDIESQFSNLSEGWWWLFLYAPKAFFLGLFRPFIWESDNCLQLIQAVERAVLFLLTMWSLMVLLSSRLRLKFEGVLTGAFVFAVMVVVAYSVPNFGSISRYSCMVIPFWVSLILTPIFKKYEK